MSDLYLNLHDRLALTDFMLEAVEYLEPNDPLRERVDHVADAAIHGGDVSIETLNEIARETARASWPARIAVVRYLKTPEGKQEEWRRVLAAVSNSTEHLLERFRGSIKKETLQEVLDHEESQTVLHEAERIEIQEVLRHILPSIWKDKKKELLASAKSAKDELGKLEELLTALRRVASQEGTLNPDEIESKVVHYEDRIYYEGEEVPAEILEQEVGFYLDEREITQ
ncbi:MAG: hypothetical protein WC477_02955 [Patescibacteria group bacterium]